MSRWTFNPMANAVLEERGREIKRNQLENQLQAASDTPAPKKQAFSWAMRFARVAMPSIWSSTVRPASRPVSEMRPRATD